MDGEGEDDEMFKIYGIEDQDGFGAVKSKEKLLPQASAATF